MVVFDNAPLSEGGETESGRLMRQPDQVGGFVTQSVCLIVDDADAVDGRVTEAGAEIVIEIKDEDHRGRGFICRDAEGHIWSIGTDDPWA